MKYSIEVIRANGTRKRKIATKGLKLAIYLYKANQNYFPRCTVQIWVKMNIYEYYLLTQSK